MTKLFTSVQTWWAELRDEERGATAVEYALMVALIAVVIITAVTLLGQEASESFDQTQQAIAST
jgi:pilus assembly protein Flp/PilA